jgi:hypothetical protein
MHCDHITCHANGRFRVKVVFQTFGLLYAKEHDEKTNGVKEVCFCYMCSCFVVESGLTCCCLWWKNKGNEKCCKTESMMFLELGLFY